MGIELVRLRGSLISVRQGSVGRLVSPKTNTSQVLWTEEQGSSRVWALGGWLLEPCSTEPRGWRPEMFGDAQRLRSVIARPLERGLELNQQVGVAGQPKSHRLVFSRFRPWGKSILYLSEASVLVSMESGLTIEEELRAGG